MEDMFLRILNLSITASYIIAAVILLRVILKKAPRWTVCALWALVAIRLVCPFTIETTLSLIPTTETVSPDVFYADMPQTTAVGSGLSATVTPAMVDSLPPADPAATVTPARTAAFFASLVWLFGSAAILLYGAGSYLLLHRRMATAVRMSGNLWQSEAVTSPFVLGFLRPNVYLPFGLDEKTMTHVIAHEHAHIRRGDHWTKLLGYILLAVHWFNPLMWVAYILLCRDIELACDEKVIRDMDRDDRRSYAAALLTCGVKGPRPRLAACPLAFGEVGVKTRVKGVMHYKKPAFWVLLAALILCAAAAVCLLTNPTEAKAAEELLAPVSYDHGEAAAEALGSFLYPESEEQAEGFDTAYWDEVSKVFGPFLNPVDVEVFVSDDYELSQPLKAVTLEEFVYNSGYCHFIFHYLDQPVPAEHESEASIRITAEDGRELIIWNDAGIFVSENGYLTTEISALSGDSYISLLLNWARSWPEPPVNIDAAYAVPSPTPLSTYTPEEQALLEEAVALIGEYELAALPDSFALSMEWSIGTHEFKDWFTGEVIARQTDLRKSYSDGTKTIQLNSYLYRDVENESLLRHQEVYNARLAQTLFLAEEEYFEAYEVTIGECPAFVSVHNYGVYDIDNVLQDAEGEICIVWADEEEGRLFGIVTVQDIDSEDSYSVDELITLAESVSKVK